jgi:hypothetical protein
MPSAKPINIARIRSPRVNAPACGLQIADREDGPNLGPLFNRWRGVNERRLCASLRESGQRSVSVGRCAYRERVDTDAA